MVRPVVWWPPAEPSPAEQAVIKAVRRARLFVFLRERRHELFDEAFQAVAELVLRRLLPLAREGLRRWGVDPGSADRLLGIIEQRCLTGRNGAVWQVATTRAISEQTGADRAEALRQMTQRYIELMHGNEPVHTWPRPA